MLLSKSERNLLATFLRPHWPFVLLLAVLLLSGIGLQLAGPQIAARFIDRAIAGEPLQQLIVIALLFAGATILTQVVSVAEAYAAETVGWRTTNALRVSLTRHVLELDGSFHAEHGPGELTERIDGDVSALSSFFSQFVVQIVGSGLFLLGVVVLLWIADWRVGLLLTLSSCVALVYLMRGGRRVAAAARRSRIAAADMSAYLEESLGALDDLKSSGADAYATRTMDTRVVARFRRTQDAWMAGSYFGSIAGAMFVLGMGGALALSAWLHGAGAMTLGTVFVVFRYSGMLRQPLERLTREMNRFQQAAGGIVRVRELLATQPRVPDEGTEALPDGPLSVELDEVSFAYDAEFVLHDVTIRVEPGEVLGLLGRTGSGKTTIARLLFRLHDPSKGAVRLGEMDLREVAIDDLRRRVGLVTQDVRLLHGTLRDNITLFDPSVPDATLIDVFDELGLRGWLAALPEGLDTPLGAGGRGLSAGEAQLVAMARVFLTDPGVVLLDEASSRLDPATERRLERAISRLLDTRTGVVIAHRLETVARADSILILEDGRVAETGRRADLERDPHSRFARLRRAGMVEVLA